MEDGPKSKLDEFGLSRLDSLIVDRARDPRSYKGHILKARKKEAKLALASAGGVPEQTPETGRTIRRRT
jgi:hypothetical protein